MFLTYGSDRTSGSDRFREMRSLAMILNACSLNLFAANSLSSFFTITGLPIF